MKNRIDRDHHCVEQDRGRLDAWWHQYRQEKHAHDTVYVDSEEDVLVDAAIARCLERGRGFERKVAHKDR